MTQHKSHDRGLTQVEGNKTMNIALQHKRNENTMVYGSDECVCMDELELWFAGEHKTNKEEQEKNWTGSSPLTQQKITDK